MSRQLTFKVHRALGRLGQVISCADRALDRDISDEMDAVLAKPLHAKSVVSSAPQIASLRDEESVKPRRDLVPKRTSESLLLSLIHPSLCRN